MAGDAHLVLVRDRHHALEEIVDAFPECIRVYASSACQWWILCGGVLVLPGFVEGIASTARAPTAHHAQNAHVVLQRGHAGGSARSNQILEGFDVAVPLR